MTPTPKLTLLAFLLLCAVPILHAQDRSPVQRDRRPNAGRPHRGSHDPDPSTHRAAQFPFEFRTIDGHGNNVMSPEWGAADIPFLRIVDADYGDGLGTPAGSTRPGPREISNAVSAQAMSVPNAAGATDFLWQWGQFLDHDIDETPLADPAEAFDIVVPLGDPIFDPMNSGTATIPLDRSAYETIEGVRQQVNLITAFIDASNVYGSEQARADELRTLDGTGRLKMSVGELLPFNVNGLANAPSPSPVFFLAGDIRANEQVGLTAMHTLFVREHNFWADQLLPILGPGHGDLIYEVSRAIVAAEMQAITYREFLPLLLGPRALSRYRGYREAVDPGISNLFATAAYRVGHTMLSSEIQTRDAAGTITPLSLTEAFFNPQEITSNGIDHILRGLAGQVCQEIDHLVIDEVRNFLFAQPGATGFDLASLNIQRGRDHGLPSYNAIRVAMGRTAAATFDDITGDPMTSARLASVYADPDEVDPWVGLLSEPHAPRAMVGETLKRILTDQFRRLRDGDRFWYQAYLPARLAEFVEQQTLSVIIRRNTGIGSELPVDVFKIGTQSQHRRRR